MQLTICPASKAESEFIVQIIEGCDFILVQKRAVTIGVTSLKTGCFIGTEL